MNSNGQSQDKLNGNSQFDFIINPELQQVRSEVSPGDHLDIVFIVRNVSGRTVLAEACLRQQPGPGGNGSKPPLDLQLQGPAEWEFEHTSVRAYTVRLVAPLNARPDTYKFQMLMVGIDNPDKQFVESSPVTIQVKTPPVDPRPFALIFLAVLVAVILLVAGAAVLLLPHQGLEVTLIKTPSKVSIGEPAQYRVMVRNRRGEAMDRVILNYAFPPGVIGASAYIPDSPVRNCDKSERSLRCDLGKLEPGASATITLEIIPGPLARSTTTTPTPSLIAQVTATVETPGPTTITQALTVNSLVGGKWIVTPVNLPNQMIDPPPANQAFSVAIDPSSKTGLVDEPMDIVLHTWSNIPSPQTVTFTYQLPKGMRYAKPLPTDCEQKENDYFTLICTRDLPKEPESNTDVTSIAIHVLPVEVSAAGFVHNLETANEVDNGLANATTTLKRSTITPVVYPPLLFNGINEWVDLGYRTALKTFTAEMWVQPFSTEDGQAFIGAHRQLPDNVLNMFLVGYYTGTLSVNVSGTYCDLDFQKTTERFHLAVSVENKGADEWWVTAYKDGNVVPWKKQEDQTGGCTIIEQSQAPAGCNGCAIFKQTQQVENRLDGGETMPWVLGQDWDWGGQGPKLSDFFHGALSEVRLWKTVRTQDQVRQTMHQRPLGNEADLEGYWRLEPVPPAASNKLVIANLTSGQYDGIRHGTTWGDPVPGFGNALSFNGINDFLYAPGLGTDSLRPGTDGKVNLTLSGWIYLDGLPTRQQWLMGFVPVALSPAQIGSGNGVGSSAGTGGGTGNAAALPPDLEGTVQLPPGAAQQAAVQNSQKFQTEAQKAATQPQVKETAVSQAQTKLATAKTPAEQQAARASLEQAQVERDAALRQYYLDQQQIILLQQNYEALLDNLNSRLDLAVGHSVDAAMSAYQQSNPGTATPFPVTSTWQALHRAALLAAQRALKSEVDGNADLAWANYQDLVAERDRQLKTNASPPPNATAVAQLNAKVDQAKIELDNALAKQRDQTGDVKIETQMAEAVAQLLAQQVTDAVLSQIQSQQKQAQTPTPTWQPGQGQTLDPLDTIKRSLKISMLQQLENVRWLTRVRLYWNLYYTQAWLSYDLAAGGDRVEVRAAKTDLQSSLASLNLALLTALRSQPVLTVDPNTGFATLFVQAADEAQYNATQQKLQDALQQSEKALNRYLTLPGPTGQAAAASPGSTPASKPAGGQTFNLTDALLPTQTETPSSANANTTPGSSSTGSPAPTGAAGTTGTPVPGTTLTPIPGTTATPTPGTTVTPTAVLTSQSQDTQAKIPPNIWAGLILTADGHVALVARQSGMADWLVFEDERPVAVGQWVHYAMGMVTFDPATGQIDPTSLRLVRNGVYAKGVPPGTSPVNVQVDQLNCQTSANSQIGFYIGGLCDAGGKYDFKGVVDDVRIWNRGLGADDVDRWRNLPGEVYDEIAYWPFDDLLGIRPAECLEGQTCNYAADDRYHLDVSGPVWVPADLSQLQHVAVRP